MFCNYAFYFGATPQNIEELKRLIEKYKISPSRLRLEITESVLIEDIERTVDTEWTSWRKNIIGNSITKSDWEDLKE